MTKTDRLKLIADQIQERLKAENLSAYQAYHLSSFTNPESAEGRDRVIYWNDRDYAWEDYLKTARQLGANVVYFSAPAFSWQKDLLDEIDRLNVYEEDREERKEEARRFNGYDGLVGRVELAFPAHGVWNVFYTEEPWFGECMDLLQTEEDEAHDAEGR